MTTSNSANWAFGKRAFHWALVLSVLVALVAPKPEDEGGGVLHILGGTIALALVFARLGQRLFGEVRPFAKDAWRLKWPDRSKGARGVAPLIMQTVRIGGFLFLALIPLAVVLALAAIGKGEESPLLEAHAAVGTTIMALAIAHAAGIVLFALITRYDLLGVTLSGGVRSFIEGGARGAAGLVIGAMLGIGALSYVWGPFDIRSKVAAIGKEGVRDEVVRGVDRTDHDE